MRAIHWLFTIAVALFVSGIGFVIAAERAARAVAPTAASETRAAPPTATVKQLMDGVVQPAASAIWNSVSTVETVDGIEEKQPRTDQEWAAVATSAALLIEAANLLLDGPRAVDRGEWTTMTRAMADAGQKALEATEAKRADRILDVGEEIYNACNTCHERYSRN